MTALARPDNDGCGEPANPVAGGGVSVVMVVYRTGPALKESLAQTLATGEVDELVVVDNGSSDQEAAWMDAAATADPRIQIVRGHGNIGFARGANLGAARSTGGLLVFLNPDAFLEAGCVPALARAIDPARRPCLVGARILNPDGSEQRGARRGEVTPLSTFLTLTRLSKRVPLLRRFEIHHEDAPPPSGPEAIPTVSGACFAMTREDFVSVGGFDEGYFLHVEDVDLCWRVRREGGAVLIQPAARVVHLGSTSLKAPLFVEYNKGLGLVRFFMKRADGASSKLGAILLAPLIVAASVTRASLRSPPPR